MDNKLVKTKPTRLKPKQKLTLSNWTNEQSETFGNLYQSAIKAGFSRSYALNLTHLRPSWLSETIEKSLEPNHIKQGIQNIATGTPNSKSPDDTRLKAYETLAKITGMMDNKPTTNITLVQPILSSASSNPRTVQNDSNNSKNNGTVDSGLDSNTLTKDTPYIDD